MKKQIDYEAATIFAQLGLRVDMKQKYSYLAGRKAPSVIALAKALETLRDQTKWTLSEHIPAFKHAYGGNTKWVWIWLALEAADQALQNYDEETR